MRTLIVIDMQNDFIDGSLGTREAVLIVPHVKEKINEYMKNGDEIVFTRDTHHENYLETNEGKHLPVVHCVKDTKGWEIREELLETVKGYDKVSFIDKPSFGYTGWNERSFEEIELVGL